MANADLHLMMMMMMMMHLDLVMVMHLDLLIPEAGKDAYHVYSRCNLDKSF